MSVAEAIFGGTLALVCLVAMISDARRRIIPNSLCLVLLAIGLGRGWYEGGMNGLGWHGAHVLVALGIGMALFALRVMGGGDGKFYAACAAWFPIGQGMTLGLMITLAGLLLALGWFALRKARGLPTFTLGRSQPTMLPYGIAIGLGTLTTFALLT